MKNEMTKNKFTCPRRVEDGMDDENSPFQGSGKNEDYWYKREGHSVCNYCGSITPEAVFEAINNNLPVGTTDKNYKLYVDLPGDGKKRSRASANFPQDGYKKVPFKKEWKAPAEPTLTFHGKFYFQHFDVAQRKQFVKLMQENKIKYSGGFGFYVLPFFVTSGDIKL